MTGKTHFIVKTLNLLIDVNSFEELLKHLHLFI